MAFTPLKLVMSTTLQIFEIPSSSTFDQPNTLAGRQWKTVLGYPARCVGFHSAWWGRHLENPERITLFIDWNNDSKAQAFRSQHYPVFFALIEPLLSTRPADPSIIDISPITICEPANYPGGGLTTLQRLTFNTLNADQRQCLLGDTLWDYLSHLRVETESCTEGYKGGYAAWELDDTGAKTATLWLLTSWTSMEAEKRCERELCTAEGLNMKDAYLEKMMEKADDGGEKHHVGWEMLAGDKM